MQHNGVKSLVAFEAGDHGRFDKGRPHNLK